MCQAVEDGCFLAPFFPFLAKEAEQNYPNYPLGPADWSSIERLLFQIRAMPFPVDLTLVLAHPAHPTSKQAFLPSPLAFPLLFRWGVRAFLPTRLYLHCCPCISAHPMIPPSPLLPGWGRLEGEESGVVSSLLVLWPCYTPVPHAALPVVLVSLKSGPGGQSKALCLEQQQYRSAFVSHLFPSPPRRCTSLSTCLHVPTLF